VRDTSIISLIGFVALAWATGRAAHTGVFGIRGTNGIERANQPVLFWTCIAAATSLTIFVGVRGLVYAGLVG
jgi:hypothetical protein